MLLRWRVTICELVGTYILNKLKNVTNKEHIGLYPDNGLGILQNIPETEIERKKKRIVKVFKEYALPITINVSQNQWISQMLRLIL